MYIRMDDLPAAHHHARSVTDLGPDRVLPPHGMFTGMLSRGDTRRYSAILWRRLGAALALDLPPAAERTGHAASR
jgi:hypothetical protein